MGSGHFVCWVVQMLIVVNIADQLDVHDSFKQFAKRLEDL
jgi:hypothetical protein